MKMKVLPALSAFAALMVAAPGAAREAGEMFDRADSNGDGEITRAEYRAARQTMFDRLDRNGDGFVARDDLGRLARRRPQAADRLQAFIAQGDANRDGRLSRRELRDSPMAMFDRADRDGNGVISRAERDAIRSALAGAR